MEQEEDVSLDLLLVICLGPLAVVLLVSYVVHWYQVRLLYLYTPRPDLTCPRPQVIQRVERNRHRLRRHEGGAGGGGAGHTKAAPMLSIRTLENQRSGDCLLVYPSNSNNLPVIYTSVPTTKEEFKVSRDVY